MLRSTLSSCLKTAAAMDAAAAAAAQKHRGAAVTALATRASSYASSNSPSDGDSTVNSPTYFSSSSLANASVQTTAPYSSSATAIRTTTCQVPLGMGISTQATPAQCYRSVEEPTLHEDYDELEMHHSVREEAHSSYYNYSYDPEEDCGEVGSIL